MSSVDPVVAMPVMTARRHAGLGAGALLRIPRTKGLDPGWHACVLSSCDLRVPRLASAAVCCGAFK